MRKICIYCVMIVAVVFGANPGLAMEANATSTKKVLSIGPGVLLGYIKIQVLEKIEEVTGKPINELFDFIGGTSTGALIASLLTHGEPGKPTYSAKEVREFYELFAPEIFAKKTINLASVLSVEELRTLTTRLVALSCAAVHMTIKQLGGEISRAEEIALKESIETANQQELARVLDRLVTPIYSSERQKMLPPKEEFIKEFLMKFELMHGFSTDGFYYDAARYQQRLEEKLGTRLVAQSIKPIALFCQKSSQSRSDVITSRLIGGGGQGQTLRALSDGNRDNIVGFSSRHAVKLADAVYASSAAEMLFPPIELFFDGSLFTVSDGDCPGFSTLGGTIEEARSLWPNDELEVFSLSLGVEIDPRDIKDTNVKVFSLRPSRLGLCPNFTDASAENFKLMTEIAEQYIASDEFGEVVKYLGR